MDRDAILFPFNVPKEAWRVEDADEEIFLLYSRLQTPGLDNSIAEATASGLGSVNSRQGELLVRIEFGPSGEDSSREIDLVRKSKASRRKGKERAEQAKPKPDSVEISLFQDVTGLRSRAGDTGSVLWRASMALARLFLSQVHFPRVSDKSFITSSNLSTLHIVELGAGTGLLSVVLAPLVYKYTATDISSLIPLIKKNQIHNITTHDIFKVSAEELDWVQLHNTPRHLQHNLFQINSSLPNSLTITPKLEKSSNKSRKLSKSCTCLPKCSGRVILAVDCIYNPALITPFLETMNYLTKPSEASSEGEKITSSVLIVLELRSEEVSREFIHDWLSLSGDWEIWNIPLLGPRYAMWFGRRRL